MHHSTRLTALCLGLTLSACAISDDSLKPFPPAKDGYARHVIQLPEQADETAYRVELIAGKTMQVDCNRHSLGGQWQQQTLDGWGYDYYELSAVGPGISTRMGCPPGSEREAFVGLAGEPQLVRYNSRLPLVIYAPGEVQVRYRIWSAGADSEAAPER
jgi:ecotin